MSDEQLKAFQAAVEADAGLQEKVNGAGDDADAVVAIAKAAGFVITAEELIRAKAEISEDELAGVTGGVHGATPGWEGTPSTVEPPRVAPIIIFPT